MRPTGRQRGLTLIEAMIAMAVLLIGATGMMAMNGQAVRLNADGRRMTRAVAIAEDMVAQLELWDYTDPRLANTTTANDADYGDSTFAFEGAPGSFAADHAEADLTMGGADWNGLPTADLAAGQFERYWNVAEIDDANGNGVPDARRIAVIVRWPQGGGYRRIVLYLAKANPDPAERL